MPPPRSLPRATESARLASNPVQPAEWRHDAHTKHCMTTRRAFSKAVAATAIAGFGGHVAHASEAIPVTGVATPQTAALDAWMQDFMRRLEVPGASLAVSDRGQLVYARGFGFADVEADRRVEPDSRFRIASITKAFTAVGVVQFVERGRLDFESKVAAVLGLKGEADPRWRQITVRQLLQHTGGWDASTFDPMFETAAIARALGSKLPATGDDVLRYMLARPLDFAPGERFEYSNFGYFLLGRLIERLGGASYQDHMQRHVLGPCGITKAVLGRTGADQAATGEVKYYGVRTGPSVLGSDETVPEPYGMWPLELMAANGGWITSAVDLLRFANAMDDTARSPLLGAQALGEIHRAPSGEAGAVQGGNFPGMGWFVWPKHSLAHRAFATTNGLIGGSASYLMRRHDGIDWAVLFNKARAPDNVPLMLRFRDESSDVLNGIVWPRVPVELAATDAVRECRCTMVYRLRDRS